MLNLPDVIYCKDNDKFLEFSYLADGTKLSMINYMDVGMIYVGPLVYFKIENDIVFGGTEFDGGRFFSTSYNGAPDIRFLVTDHLGSVRRVLDANLNLVEQNDYYPFGKRIDDPEKLTADNIYRYNGKESLEIFGIPYSDYGARLFDSNIGRWLQTDPLAQDYPNISPYAFCANNPIKYVDSDGRMIGDYYDVFGNFITNDGIDDDKIYISSQDAISDYRKELDSSGDQSMAIKQLKKGSEEVDGIIIVDRNDITSEHTMGSFDIIGDDGFSGYTMERSGKPTTQSGQNRPIPYGLYNTAEREEGYISGSFAFRIFNDEVPIGRGILGHIGNHPWNSSGCILFGLERGKVQILKSRDAMSKFEKYFEDKNNIKLIIR